MNDEKIVLASAAAHNQKYYINPDIKNIPPAVFKELKEICIGYAAKFNCIFSIVFHPNGKLYIETTAEEDAEKEILELISQEEELIKSLELWHKIFMPKKEGLDEQD